MDQIGEDKHRGMAADPSRLGGFGPRYDDQGVDLTLLAELAKLTPEERLERNERAARSFRELRKAGRKHRGEL